MSAIAAKANLEYRDAEAPGSTVEHEPVKLGIRELMALIDLTISTLGVATGGAITVKKATLDLLNADLAYVAGTLAIVYGDTTQARNGIYAKVGGSGSGSWSLSSIALPASFATDLATVLALALEVDADARAAAISAAAATDAAANALTAASAAQTARDDALGYAELTGPFVFYATKAAANAGLAGLSNGQQVQVWADESQSGVRTVYVKTAGTYVLITSLSYVSLARLAQADGGGLIGYRSPGAAGAISNVGAQLNSFALLVENYREAADAGDDSLAINRALARALILHCGIRSIPGSTLTLKGPVEILPDYQVGALVPGWTPPIDLSQTDIVLVNERSGFRVRGIKDGQTGNATSGFIAWRTLDAASLAVSNGVRCFFASNASRYIVRGDIINLAAGYGVRFFRYCDGGATIGANSYIGNIRGPVDNPASDLNAYYYADDGDLSVGMPGASIANGTTIPIATTSATADDGTACRRSATTFYWTNSSGSPVTIPSVLTEASLISAGLSKGSSTKALSGTLLDAVDAEYYESQGTRIADCVVRGGGNYASGVFDGGYYHVYIQGNGGAIIDTVRSLNAVRGIVGQWNATYAEARSLTINGAKSSSILFNHGSPGFHADHVKIALGTRWDGQAAVNFQLNSGSVAIDALEVVTDPGSTGEYAVYFGPGCGNSRIRNLYFKGRVIKAFVAAESAWRSTTGGPENYPAQAFYAGAFVTPLTNIAIDDVTIEVDSSISTAVTALALIQTGQIGLSDVRVKRFRAVSTKHTYGLRIIEEATVPATNGVNRVILSDVKFDPAITSDRWALPRGLAHFAQMPRDVTMLDDDVERGIPAGATPDLTFGKDFVLNSGTTLTGLLGGYEGKRISLRGLDGSGFQTVNHTGASNGIRLRGSQPVVPFSYEKVVLEYRTAVDGWMEVGSNLGAIYGEKTYDPPSLAAAARDTTTVTVTGAKLGQVVRVSFNKDMQGIQLFGYVSAANTVTVVFVNGTAGTIDLASGLLAARVSAGRD